MSRFYFHVRYGDHLYLDVEGIRLHDLRRAWEHALQDAREVGQYLLGEPTLPEQWIEVDDGRGQVLACARFGKALH